MARSTTRVQNLTRVTGLNDDDVIVIGPEDGSRAKGITFENFQNITAIPIQDDGIEIVDDPTALNFIGPGATVVNNLGVADITIPAGATNTIEFDTSGAYVPSANVTSIQFICTGGGGGGGGTINNGAGTAASGSCGSAAGTVIVSTNSIEASYTMVVGAVGAGAAAGSFGATGGNTTITSIGVNITASGGLGGLGQNSTATTYSTGGGRIGGAATGGDVNIDGGASTAGSQGGGIPLGLSVSGASFWGGGAQSPQDGIDGFDAEVFGAGGGAGNDFDAGSNLAGGDGGAGIIMITEYF